MATEKQTEANRRNAQHSTGPRTEEGKNQSRLNAIKHGLAGHLDAAPDPARDAFVAEMVDNLKPAGAMERQLATSVADASWRINRISAVETSLIASDADDDILRTMNLLTTYEMRLHRKLKSDLRELREIQAARRAAEEKKSEQEAAAARQAFEEACVLLELNMRQDVHLELSGTFTHPNGFVYSIPKLLHTMAINRRMDKARRNLATNPFTAAELQRYSEGSQMGQAA